MLYTKEENLWITEKNISNTAGNLCLHISGNLNHFIGKQLGGTDYIRDRALEFSAKNVAKASLLEGIEETIEMVEETFGKMDPSILNTTYPIEVFGEPVTTGYFLAHLATHLSYHLGQINYHRRLLDIA
jgi:uncharacterized damage-inducible protein DinB